MTSSRSLEEAGKKPLEVLIVEDNPDDRALLRRMLGRGGGFRIAEADGVGEGLRLARAHAPDCVLLDYQLPDGDGFDFLHACLQQGAAPDAAIIMVTGRGSERAAAEAMKRGALDYVRKDGLFEGHFAQTVLEAVERARQRAQAANARHALEKSRRALSDFAHTAAHDLKAPLRHIVSYCNLIAEDFAGKIGAQGEEYLQRLTVNAARAQRLVDDLVAYADALGEREEKSAVDSGAVVSALLEALGEQIRAARARISVGPLPVLQAGPQRLQQLFRNLIVNALAYRAPERDPVIALSCARQGAEYLFRVADNGPGVEAEFREAIFEPFKRLHSRDEIEGSGLGLAAGRRIVEELGGRLWAEETPGGGATFCFTLPVPASEQQMSGEEAPARAGAAAP